MNIANTELIFKWMRYSDFGQIVDNKDVSWYMYLTKFEIFSEIMVFVRMNPL